MYVDRNKAIGKAVLVAYASGRSMNTNEPEILLNIEGPLGWVIINRPAARNALSLSVWRGIAAHMEALASNRDVRVVIVRGAGEEAFLAGADITEFPAIRANAQATLEYDRQTAQALHAIEALPQPAIAMINGACFGGGCSVALACDVRIAAHHAKLAIPAARLGLAYPFVDNLVHTVGKGNAADVLLSARTLDAEEALRIGLVNRVVPRAELEANVRRYALQVAEGAPLTLAAHKAAIQEATRREAERDPARLQKLVESCFDSDDYREGVAAFIEKRKAKFVGR